MPDVSGLFLAPNTPTSGSPAPQSEINDEENDSFTDASDHVVSLALRNLKFLPKAREAANRNDISDRDVREVLETATEVRPDRDFPNRTRVVKGAIALTLGSDGIILAVHVRRFN